MSAVQRLVTYQLVREGLPGGQVTALFSEQRDGFAAGDPFLARELTMRASTSQPVRSNDVLLHSSTGVRYRVGLVERLGQRYILELSREA